MNNFIVIDAFNHALIGASTALRKNLPESDFKDFLYQVLEGMIVKLKRTFPGTYYACWDSPGGTKFRKELSSDYKATRAKSPLPYETLMELKDYYALFGINNITLPTCEGDDAIFALCKVLREANPQARITVVSRDHDLIQVAQEGYATEIYDPVKKVLMELPYYSVVEYKALVGDSSDNLAGVSGIGPKTALKVISGMQPLTESQKEEYERMLDIIDAKRNPNLENNIKQIKELLVNKTN